VSLVHSSIRARAQWNRRLWSLYTPSQLLLSDLAEDLAPEARRATRMNPRNTQASKRRDRKGGTAA
jgi:hypothetical protein